VDRAEGSEACDLVVVGAGAAGLAAAIFAAERGAGAKIVVLDGAEKIGAKILISGGGRCNVTHDEVRAADFNGARPVVRNILAAFDAGATVRWFASLGVPLKREETGKLFPVSDQAHTVLDALLRRCAALGVAVCPAQRVSAVDVTDAGFVIVHAGGTLVARRVILATGGRSLPRTGSDGSGWDMARHLGHTVTDTHPGLVPLVLGRVADVVSRRLSAVAASSDPTASGPAVPTPTAGLFHAALSGLSQPVELSTFADGKLIDRRTGSLLWTHFGVSGPAVMDASRHWVIAQAAGRRVEVLCSFIPGRSFEEIERDVIDAGGAHPRQSLRTFLARTLPDRLGVALAAAAGVAAATPMAQLARAARRRLVHVLTAFVLPVERARGWDFAEVTAGGVPLDEIDYRTMESRRVPGLYLVGEMLDCDGRIGGYNFQWAWATGFLAGRAAARA